MKWLAGGVIIAMILVMGVLVGMQVRTEKRINQLTAMASAATEAPTPPQELSGFASLEKAEPQKNEQPTVCRFSSDLLGLMFDYIPAGSGSECIEKQTEEEITNYLVLEEGLGIMIFPRSGLSGKAWWNKYITDEVGFLADNKYDFETSKTILGVAKLRVSIDDETISYKEDGITPGVLRGSD